MTLKRNLLYILLLVFSASCTQKKAKSITEFSQEDLKNGILVDVRTPKEFQMGHLEDARNVNWLEPGFTAYFDSIPKSKTVYLYCKKGGRSAKAAALLDSLGYSVVDLRGGYDAYVENK